MTATATRRRAKAPSPKSAPKRTRRWRPEYQGRRTVAADAAYQEIKRIGGGTNSRPKPGKVVNASRPTRAVLHEMFTWDDRVCGEIHRRNEAREIINGTQPIIVSVDSSGDETETATAPQSWVRVASDEAEEAEYREIEVVMEDPKLRRRAMLHCLAQMRAMANRYEEFAKLLGTIKEIEKEIA